jgi:putative membrane protein
VGVSRLWSHAGAARGLSRSRVAAFTAGWATLVVALASPLDTWGGQLFSAHMLQHELLMVVAAPLLVLGRPLGAWTWSLPAAWRRGVGAALHHPAWRRPWRVVTPPLGAWLLHAAALWLWHVPACFEAALHDNTVHAWQHASFLFTATLFWWAVLGTPERARSGTALALLFTTLLHTAALGALLALSPLAWYPAYATTAPALGWDPLDDQQLGGVLMWAPSGLVYLVAALAQVAGMLDERRRGTGEWAWAPED